MPQYLLTWTNTQTFTGVVDVDSRADVDQAWQLDDMYDVESTEIEQECRSVVLVPEVTEDV